MHCGPYTSPTLTIDRAQGGVPYRRHCYVASHLSEQRSKRRERPSVSAESFYWSMQQLSLFVTISDMQIARVAIVEGINPGYILASVQQPDSPAYTEGQVQTCQVKKGMSPSCKHFLSGREHFLNPGATKPFLILHQTTADSDLLSFPITLSLQ